MTITPNSTALAAAVKASVGHATELLEAAYPAIDIRVHPDAQGGAWIEMMEVPIGPPYAQQQSFVVFLLPFNLPGIDIYPLFVRPDLARLDGAPLRDGFQVTQLAWPAEPTARAVVQVSRRTRGAFAMQTAPQKIAKVLDWMLAQ